MTPLQSLSAPSQVSGWGSTLPTQRRAPAWHCTVPNAHGKLFDWPHETPLPCAPSSMTPLQLSSMLLQASAVGLSAPTQSIWPFWHCIAPKLHGAVFDWPHAAPAPGMLLSTVPSQSSSAPLQLSAAGSIAPMQLSDPPTHWITPF